VAQYRMKYRLAVEIYISFESSSSSPHLLECLQGYDLSAFSLGSFREHVMGIEIEKLPGVLLDMPVNGITGLLDSEHNLLKSFLDAKAFMTCIKEFIDCVFALASELQNSVFYAKLDDYRKKIQDEEQNVIRMLSQMDPLELSDKLMRKSMFRRGPYTIFLFAPSVFSGRRAVRYVGKNQILFFSIRDFAYDNDYLLKQLKALADDTRFRIVAMLKERSVMQGSEIVMLLELSASTVSHHMKVLRESGLVCEQIDGAAKYYSLMENLAQEITSAITEFLP
ncbi:MAG: metalloregulator ArsR/SmtB family transcription factor, partial [Oscillospiraceae bacterium]|nr:metalloregulator ArsR/SmtB family transcription factor [Oscillospiraceae bacterium]